MTGSRHGNGLARKKAGYRLSIGLLSTLVACLLYIPVYALEGPQAPIEQDNIALSLPSSANGHEKDGCVCGQRSDKPSLRYKADMDAVYGAVARVDFRNRTRFEPILQNPELPNGCELASLTAMLRYEGFDVLFKDLDLPKQGFSHSSDGDIRYGPDPAEYYVGDPSSATSGWYCFEQPLMEAANSYLSNSGSRLRARSLTGTSLDELEHWLKAGTPVAVWFTTDYEMPRRSKTFSWVLSSGSTYIPYINLHCVVLLGADESSCILADPLRGMSQVDRSIFESVYNAMGRRALVLALPNECSCLKMPCGHSLCTV